MSAEIGSRFIKTDRTPLQTVIPLDTPYLLFIDPSSLCNFRCCFCPCGGANKDQWAQNKTVGVLSYSTYRKIIDDAVNFPHKIKTLRLYKEGEPLLNKRLPDMIQYARKRGVCEKIDFTTNGVLLNEDLTFALMDAGVDRINISIEALDEAGYEKVSGVKINFKRFLYQLKHLYLHKNGCHIFMKINDVGLGEHTEKDFFSIFGDLCDEISVESVTPVWPEFNLEKVKTEFTSGIYGNDINKIDVCPYIFYSICINSDASVSACLMDWNHRIIVGNAVTDSISHIWNSDAMQKMRIDHLQGKRGLYPVCKNCGQLAYGALDNVDAYREEILQKYFTNKAKGR